MTGPFEFGGTLAGGIVGGALGAAGGGAVGTFVEPGGGTVVGAFAGRFAGSRAGGAGLGYIGRSIDGMLGFGDQSVCGGNCAAAKKADDADEKNKKPANKAPAGADRDQAYDAAKKANDIPSDQEPDVNPNYGNNPTPDSKARSGSENLDHLDSNGDDVTIRHDYGGDSYPDGPSQDRGPHFNDPAGNHYDYTGPRIPFGPLRK